MRPLRKNIPPTCPCLRGDARITWAESSKSREIPMWSLAFAGQAATMIQPLSSPPFNCLRVMYSFPVLSSFINLERYVCSLGLSVNSPFFNLTPVLSQSFMIDLLSSSPCYADTAVALWKSADDEEKARATVMSDALRMRECIGNYGNLLIMAHVI